MARLSKLLLTSLVVVLLLPAVAYADQTEEARRLLDQANALIDQVSALDSEGQELFTQVGQIDVAAENAGDALPLLEQAAANIEEIGVKLEALAALVDEAGALDVSPELKTYLGLRKEITELDLETYAVTGDLIAQLRTAYSQWPELSKAERAKLRTEVVDLDAQLQTLVSEGNDKQTASEQYYTEKQIEAELAGSGGSGYLTSLLWTMAWLAPLGFGSYLLGRWYRLRKRRRAVQGPRVTGTYDPEGGHDVREE